ncbi:hypothetical protein [Paraflavitalea speifideaquila]|uniref:hypothetical protein n=1 Tax=Paraflavitalea speifideaquila TaxID=3076558 RepID=UPI0028E85F2B|nr:hypothetical protein [Paraflavitalea speifideiaquila]
MIIPGLSMFHYSSNTRNGIECPMGFYGKLMVSQAKSTLSGSFITEPKYKYTCPELRTSFTLDNANQDSLLNNMVTGKRSGSPSRKM